MAFRGAAANFTTTPQTSVSVTVSGIGGAGPQNGDVVILVASRSTNNAGAPTFPSGFSTTFGGANLNSGLSIPANSDGADVAYIAYKIAGASEPSSYTVTGPNNRWMLVCRVYSGRSANPFTVTPVTTTPVASANVPVSLSMTGLTANSGDDLLLVIPGSLQTQQATDYSLTAPSGFGDVRNDTGYGTEFTPMVFSCDKTNVAAGATGTLTGTITGFSGVGTGYGAWLISMAAPYVLVQSASASSFSTGVSSLSATMPKAVTAGNTLIAYVGCVDLANAAGTYTVSDNVNSGNYVADITNAGSGNFSQGIFRMSAAAAGTPTVTVQRATGASTGHIGIVVEEWAGIAPTNPADQAISNFNGVINQSPTSGNTGNYFESGELMLAIGTDANSLTWSAGSGFLMSPQTAGGLGGLLAAESTVLSSTTATAATFGITSSQFWQVSAVAYKPISPNLGAQTINAQTGGMSGASLRYGLTNQSSTSSVGTITSEVDITLGALTATFVEGQLLNQISLIGQTASFSQGTITTAISGNVILALSGQSMGFSQGQLSLGISYLLDQDTITLVGQTATFALGVLQANLIVPLTAQTLASTEGTITSAPSYTLGALTVTSLEGSITSSLGNNTNQSLIGQNITSSQGAMQFLPGATFPSNTLSFTEGTITFSATGDFTVSLTGLTINSVEGTITFTGTAPGFLTMPNVVGIGWLHASHILEKAGLFQTQPPLRVLSKVYPTYTVLGQEPPAGSLVPLNSAVQLTVSIDAPLLGASFDVLPLF